MSGMIKASARRQAKALRDASSHMESLNVLLLNDRDTWYKALCRQVAITRVSLEKFEKELALAAIAAGEPAGTVATWLSRSKGAMYLWQGKRLPSQQPATRRRTANAAKEPEA